MELIHKLALFTRAALKADYIRAYGFAELCQHQAYIAQSHNQNSGSHRAHNIALVPPLAVILVITVEVQLLHKHQHHCKGVLGNGLGIGAGAVHKLSLWIHDSRAHIGVSPGGAELQKLKILRLQQHFRRRISQNYISLGNLSLGKLPGVGENKFAARGGSQHAASGLSIKGYKAEYFFHILSPYRNIFAFTI